MLKRLARARLRPTTTTTKPEPTVPWSTLTFLEFATRLGVPLTAPQRVLIKIAADGAEPQDLEGEEFEIAQKLLKPATQLEPVLTIPQSARGVLTMVKGARIGGTYIWTLYLCWRALTADLSPLAPGERARAIVGAAEDDQATQAHSYAVGAFESHPELQAMIVRQLGDRFVIERPQDGRQVDFRFRPASRAGRGFRGRWLVAAVLTEVAFFQDATHVVNDEDVFNAVSPRVLPGGLTVLESTPWLEAGLLFAEFDRNWGNPTTSIAVHSPTLFMLPTETNKQAVAREELRNPENAAREFGALFVAHGTSLFFSRESIKRATRPDLKANPGRPGAGELAGIGGDLGLVQDAAGFVAVHRVPAPERREERRDPATDRYQVAEWVERRPQRGLPLKLGELVPLACDVAERHGERFILVDGWNLQAAREHLPPKGFSLDVDPTDTADVFLAVRDLMTEGCVDIPGEADQLIKQLALVLQKPKSGGGIQVILPRRFGTHLDLVSAFVRAVWRAKSRTSDIAGPPPAPKVRPRAAAGGY